MLRRRAPPTDASAWSIAWYRSDTSFTWIHPWASRPPVSASPVRPSLLPRATSFSTYFASWPVGSITKGSCLPFFLKNSCVKRLRSSLLANLELRREYLAAILRGQFRRNLVLQIARIHGCLAAPDVAGDQEVVAHRAESCSGRRPCAQTETRARRRGTPGLPTRRSRPSRPEAAPASRCRGSGRAAGWTEARSAPAPKLRQARTRGRVKARTRDIADRRKWLTFASKCAPAY